MREKTCWKSPNGTCIDLVISNQKHSLINTSTLETGLSDHHLLIYTMLKMTYDKLPPRIVTYRDYRNFDNDRFLPELSIMLQYNSVNNYDEFNKIFSSLLDRYAPFKTKILRANNQPHVTKDLRKAIMKRSSLKNVANKSGNPEDWANYKRQRNLVVNMNRQTKKSFITRNGDTSRGFWKEIKPLFNNKTIAGGERILLVDNGKIVSDDSKTASIFNSYFNRVTDELNLPAIIQNPSISMDPVSAAIEKFSSHPSVLAIKAKHRQENCFEFAKITKDTMVQEIMALNSRKKVSGSIPIKTLQLAADICAPVLTDCFNSTIVSTLQFPDKLKLADIVPVHKKGSTTTKSNYRPISLLPTVAKVFERLIAKQIAAFVEGSLSKYLCGFRKGYSPQYALINMLRKWQACLNNSGKVGAILMDLSKAFDCLPHDLLIAKMAAYGFGRKSLQLFSSYLRNRMHRVFIGSSFSEWLKILIGVPQGSVLGPILFNIFINDLFLLTLGSDICNFADDNTLYACDTSIDNVLRRLEEDVIKVSGWFKYNGMVANPDKFQVLFPGSTENIVINIGTSLTIESKENVKLLGITIDRKLSFFPHIKEVCRQASSKTKALMRIRRYLHQTQADILYNAYILSYFEYCPLVWMFCNKQAHNLINSTHQRALCAKNNCFTDSFEQILLKTNSVAIHTRNLRLLLLEIFKSIKRLNPEIMWDTFAEKVSSYRLRCGSSLHIPRISTVSGLNSFDFRASLAWNNLPAVTKDLSTISAFRNAILNIKIYCNCKQCS